MSKLVALARRSLNSLAGPNTPASSLRDAQMRAMTRQLPLLYIILALNTDLLGWSFIDRAPLLLSAAVPVAFTAMFVWRGVAWWRLSRAASFEPAVIAASLRGVVSLCVGLGVVCSAWALALCGYGDEAGKLHVAFYMSVTVIGCIFCLIQVPRAALALTASVMIPFFAAFIWLGGRDIPLVLVNAALVFIGLLLVLSKQYAAFTALVASHENLLEARRASDTLHAENVRLANLDQLTGLPNRRIFFEVLAGRMASTDPVAVAIVDLDGFKPLNDVYGHKAGDLVLQQAAERLVRHAGPGVVARLGGDEFAVIVCDRRDPEALLAWGEELCRSLRRPYALEGATARLSGSVGLSPFAQPGDKGGRLLELADYALYSAKTERRGEAALFTHRHGEEMHRMAVVGQALRSDVLSDELSVVFQPLVDVRTGRTLAFEALARWRSSTLGIVSPQEFIGVAERLGLVSELTFILLRKALATAETWPEDVRLSFNLSAHDIMRPDVISEIDAILRGAAFSTTRIDFEITETALMSNFDRAAASLERLRSLGCGLSLDDFGTGQSSLSYVHRLPLNKIKIDRSFVIDLEERGTAASIIGAIVSMCRSLNLDCVVEGVETPEQALRLQQLGCRTMQGYLFSPALEAGALPDYLSGHPSVTGRERRRKAVGQR